MYLCLYEIESWIIIAVTLEWLFIASFDLPNIFNSTPNKEAYTKYTNIVSYYLSNLMASV